MNSTSLDFNAWIFFNFAPSSIQRVRVEPGSWEALWHHGGKGLEEDEKDFGWW